MTISKNQPTEEERKNEREFSIANHEDFKFYKNMDG
jgi:hypothetical protein